MNQVDKVDAKIVAKHYLVACLWADANEGTNPRSTAQAKKVALQISADFLKWVKVDRLPIGYDLPRLGHDLYMASQGHGVGFWDRRELQESGLGEYLTTLSKKYDRVYPEFYRGWLYLHGSTNIA